MREILFRGKRIDNGEWEEGFLFVYRSQYGIVKIVYDKTYIRSDPDTYMCDIDDLYYPKVLPETVGQFTGLVDKNDKRIFEGDIVKYGNHVYAVEWYEPSCGFEPFSDSVGNCGHCGGGMYPGSCEVVGNIYDNKGLLDDLDRWDGY